MMIWSAACSPPMHRTGCGLPISLSTPPVRASGTCARSKTPARVGSSGTRVSDRMKARIALDAITSAVSRRGDPVGCIVHTDRGSQFRSRKVQRALHRHGLVGSMGRVGAAGDNAAKESFFALLQNNVLDRRRSWAIRQELRIAIVTWIERTYHRRRRQARLGRLTPVQYETIMTPSPALAA